MIEVSERREADRSPVEDFPAVRHSKRVARLGRLENPLHHPALLAERDGALAGVLTYVIGAQLHPGAVDDSRTRLKPELPEVGDHGIPPRDELVLDKELT